MLRLAQSTNDPALLPHARHFWEAHHSDGRVPFRQRTSRKCDHAYDPDPDRPLIFRYGGVDAGVRSLSYLAMTLWQLGYPDQALKRGNEALVLAQKLSHPFSLALAQIFLAFCINFGGNHAQL